MPNQGAGGVGPHTHVGKRSYLEGCRHSEALSQTRTKRKEDTLQIAVGNVAGSHFKINVYSVVSKCIF